MTEAPLLLVSVRDPTEAAAALAGGTDVIDIKEPARGPLGMADFEQIEAIIERANSLANGVPISTALGDLPKLGPAPVLPDGLWLAKVGLAGWRGQVGWQNRLDEWDRALPVPLVPAAYADAREAASPDIQEILEWCLDHQPPFLLIDTARKDGRCLFDHLSVAEIQSIRQSLAARSIRLALAGSLQIDHLARASTVGPAIIAVRGAVCAGLDRRQAVDADLVRRLRTRLAPGSSCTAAEFGER